MAEKIERPRLLCRDRRKGAAPYLRRVGTSNGLAIRSFDQFEADGSNIWSQVHYFDF